MKHDESLQYRGIKQCLLKRPASPPSSYVDHAEPVTLSGRHCVHLPYQSKEEMINIIFKVVSWCGDITLFKSSLKIVMCVEKLCFQAKIHRT